MELKVTKLETPRLILRRYKLSDINAYIEYRANENLHTFLPTKVRPDIDGYKNSLTKIIRKYNHKTEPALTWAIELKNEQKIVGSVSVENVLWQHKLCEIGWALNVNYQHLGIAFEASKALMNYLFTNFDFNRIQAFIWEGNVASKNLALKLGFTFEGTDRKARIKNDKFLDIWNFGILRNEWEQQKNNKE